MTNPYPPLYRSRRRRRRDWWGWIIFFAAMLLLMSGCWTARTSLMLCAQGK